MAGKIRKEKVKMLTIILKPWTEGETAKTQPLDYV